MALTVEDGTGLANADAYVSVAAFKVYADAMGLSYAGKTDDQLEAAIRQATFTLDSRYRFVGIKGSSAQALEFPRADAVDWDGVAVTGLPSRVVRATSELAAVALTTRLTEVLSRGGRIKSESVGSISVTYADDAPVGSVVQAADELLRPLLRVLGEERIPITWTPAEGAPTTSITSGFLDTTTDD